MWSTRSLHRPVLAILLLAGLTAAQAGPAGGDDAGTAARITLEIRGLHYDAGDPVLVRISAQNDGDEPVANPLADPLGRGFQLTDADGKTYEPAKAGKARPEQRPARLGPDSFFGTVVDLAAHFPVLANVGRYRLTYHGTDADSNEVELNIIPEFNAGSTFEAVIRTAEGELKLELYADPAPLTVRSFVDLARQGFYDGLTFHYVRPGDLLIGGDPNGDGTGGSGFSMPAEFNSRKHLTGTVGMVRTADPNSASSQFYICLAPRPERDGRFTVFGQLVEGFDTLEKLASIPTSGQDERPYYRPQEPLVIESITIIETEAEPESGPAT